MLTVIYFIIFAIQNVLSFCPEECSCNDQSLKASCIHTGLEVMPMTLNPSLKMLILRENNFPIVDGSLKFYQELILLDLSFNQVMSVPARAFSSQKKLIELRMNDNEISEIHQRTFTGLGRLRVLLLEKNLITKIVHRVFKHLSSLRKLKLNSNKISEISEEGLHGLGTLSVLDLSDNLLETIPSNALQHLKALEELNLSKNSIKIVDDRAILSSSISKLDISGNMIHKIHEKAFIEAGELQDLNIEDNKLLKVPGEAFQALQKLEALKIGQNQFDWIDENDFKNIPRLKNLDISGCTSLRGIRKNALSSLKDLEILTITSNRKLKHLHHQALSLDKKSKLKKLTLSNNALSSLPPSLQFPVSSLSYVDLSGNPWTCDCHISIISNFLNQNFNTSKEIPSVKCWNPPDYRGRNILLLLEEKCEEIKTDDIANSPLHEPSLSLVPIILAVVITLLLCLIIIVIFTMWKQVKACVKLSLCEPDNNKVNNRSGILQFDEFQDPHYMTVHHPRITTRIINNPHESHKTLFRHDQYFQALNRQLENQYRNELPEHFYLHQEEKASLVTMNNRSQDFKHVDKLYYSIK